VATTKRAKATPGGVAVPASSSDAWGEEWLRAWIAEAPDDAERVRREWQAEGWRAWSLETWAYWANEERRTLGGRSQSEFNVVRRAAEHLALYKRDRNGLLVWRAYREFRSEGLPVPEVILAKLDQWAAQLESASGAPQVANAIEMSGSRGGPQAAARLFDLERQRRVVKEVAFRLKLKRPGQKMTEIYEAAARELRILSWRTVQKTYTEWLRKSRKKA
jgi:hypothetical protein